MKQNQKMIISAVIVVITAFFVFNNRVEIPTDPDEKRAVFISYLEYKKHFANKNEQEIKKEIDNMIKTIKDYNLNMIILQVRPFSDAIYPSKIFPTSSVFTGTEGDKLPVDVLKYFIEKAHESNIELHAWVNPYRISNTTDISQISKANPAYKWLDTNLVKVIPGKGIYYNPASEEVMDLVISGIKEIVENYDVDGIHLDDYFYPDETIDLEDYQQFKNTISLKDFRLSNTNKLISNIYQTIKKINPKVLFGISPEGNIENNYQNNYADVKKWVTEKGYVDYIMPQLYYGFFNEKQPFIKTLNDWKDMIKIDIDLISALALYKSGLADEYAKSGREEWLQFNDIITKQIKVIRRIDEADGFSLFRYDYLLPNESNPNLTVEQKNLKQILNILP